MPLGSKTQAFEIHSIDAIHACLTRHHTPVSRTHSLHLWLYHLHFPSIALYVIMLAHEYVQMSYVYHMRIDESIDHCTYTQIVLYLCFLPFMLAQSSKASYCGSATRELRLFTASTDLGQLPLSLKTHTSDPVHILQGYQVSLDEFRIANHLTISMSTCQSSENSTHQGHP